MKQRVIITRDYLYQRASRYMKLPINHSEVVKHVESVIEYNGDGE